MSYKCSFNFKLSNDNLTPFEIESNGGIRTVWKVYIKLSTAIISYCLSSLGYAIKCYENIPTNFTNEVGEGKSKDCDPYLDACYGESIASNSITIHIKGCIL